MLPILSAVALMLSSATGAAAPTGKATVSLEELIPLLPSAERKEPKPRPPVDAVLVQSTLVGHLAPDVLLIEAHFEVNVLATERWVRFPLVAISPDVYVTSLSAISGAVVAPMDGHLALLTQTAGAYSFDVGLRVRASSAGTAGALRKATLRASAGGLQTAMTVTVESAFTLVEPRSGGDTVEVFPQAGVWTVAWQSASPRAMVKESVAQRPPLEPLIPKATASWVSTLEGKLGIRVRYALQLDRPQELQLELPEGQRLERVTVNGRPVAVSPEGRSLRVPVAPASVGESKGTLELVLAENLGVLHLSGRLRLVLPSASWPISEVEARASFPAVFNYRREGGSLEELDPARVVPDADPAPGKALHFRQYLVSGSLPDVELRYSVDIARSYFR